MSEFKIFKSNDELHEVFGWANVSARVDGELITDFQDDIIEPEELEKAVYDFTANFGTAGEMHQKSGVGKLIESVVFTKEKMSAMGIPPGTVPEGWWVGFHIEDNDVWDKVKNGSYSMFSIEGTAVREKI